MLCGNPFHIPFAGSTVHRCFEPNQNDPEAAFARYGVGGTKGCEVAFVTGQLSGGTLSGVIAVRGTESTVAVWLHVKSTGSKKHEYRKADMAVSAANLVPMKTTAQENSLLKECKRMQNE